MPTERLQIANAIYRHIKQQYSLTFNKIAETAVLAQVH